MADTQLVSAFTKILADDDVYEEKKKNIPTDWLSTAAASKWLSGRRGIDAPVFKCYGGRSVGASA